MDRWGVSLGLIKPEERRLKNKFHFHFLSQCLSVVFVKVFLQIVFWEGRLSKRKQGVSYLMLDLTTAVLLAGLCSGSKAEDAQRCFELIHQRYLCSEGCCKAA